MPWLAAVIASLAHRHLVMLSSRTARVLQQQCDSQLGVRRSDLFFALGRLGAAILRDWRCNPSAGRQSSGRSGCGRAASGGGWKGRTRYVHRRVPECASLGILPSPISSSIVTPGMLLRYTPFCPLSKIVFIRATLRTRPFPLRSTKTLLCCSFGITPHSNWTDSRQDGERLQRP